MNPECAKCKKTVYPMEKLNCLDKFWHKLCFKCEVCGLTLNMKTYKGYKKLPYCDDHYPSTQFTTVSDIPESKRIASKQSHESHVVDHNEFKGQGQYTSVTDDPEKLRARKMHVPPPEGGSGRGDRKAPVPYAPAEQNPAATGPKYVALYDYNAADDDEVSCIEGDVIFEVENIDDGWVTGRVERTGAHGMLPANYVEKSN